MVYYYPMFEKPLQSVLVKPAGPDCNLRCHYCFYLHKQELFGETTKHRMSLETLEDLVQQVMTQGTQEVSFGWQGGEPTLMGLDFFKQAADFQQRFGRNQKVGNGLQTNGLLIDRDWARFLNRYQFLVGLSLDGPEEVHDRYRLTKGEQGSWNIVENSARLLLDSGVAVNSLTVVNRYSADYPEEIYRYLKEVGFTYMQFIPCLEADPSEPHRPADFSVTPQQFGSFLCRLFDLWYQDFDRGLPTISIRYFDSLLHSYLGLSANDCSLHKTCGDYLVIEHNGDVYSCDFFVDPEHYLGNISNDRLIDLLNSDHQNQFGDSKAVLAGQCLNCSWLAHCHGGCLKDRLRNPRTTSLTYLCESYRQFFNYADRKLQQTSSRVRVHLQEQQQAMIDGAHPDQGRKIGRNSPCPCGSGRKYKKCCGKSA